MNNYQNLITNNNVLNGKLPVNMNNTILKMKINSEINTRLIISVFQKFMLFYTINYIYYYICKLILLFSLTEISFEFDNSRTSSLWIFMIFVLKDFLQLAFVKQQEIYPSVFSFSWSLGKKTFSYLLNMFVVIILNYYLIFYYFGCLKTNNSNDIWDNKDDNFNRDSSIYKLGHLKSFFSSVCIVLISKFNLEEIKLCLNNVSF